MKRLATRVQYRLKPAPPFRLDLTVWALRRQPDNILDRQEGGGYKRALIIHNEPVELSVVQTGDADEPWLDVKAEGELAEHDLKVGATSALERLLGVRINLADFYRLAESHERLGNLARRFRGLKPPRFPTVFEALVNGIACQQLSLHVGITLLNRLCQTYGRSAHGSTNHAFPQPDDLANAGIEDLRDLGFSRQKARAIIELATAVAGVLDLEQLYSMSNDDVAALLRQLRGVGRWTAEYVLLRGLGRLDVFPADDIGGRGNLRRWLDLSQSLDYESTHQALAPLSPYAGLLYFHLLLDRLSEADCIR